MNCPQCKHLIKPGQKFCPACGAKIMMPNLDTEKTVAADDIEYYHPDENTSAPNAWHMTDREDPEKNAWQGAKSNDPQQDAWHQAAQYSANSDQNTWNQSAQEYDSYQSAYQQQDYGTATAVKKKSSSRVAVLIILIAVIVAGGIVAGFFAFKGCSTLPDYKAAINDMMEMMSDGKYEEAIEKYSIDGAQTLTEADRQRLAMLQGITFTADIEDDQAVFDKRGEDGFDSKLSAITEDEEKQSTITDIVVVPVTVSAKGTIWTGEVDQTRTSTFTMGLVNGQWKLSGRSFIPE